MRESKVTAVGGILFWLACSLGAIKDIYDGSMSGDHAVAWIAAFAILGGALITDSFATNPAVASRQARVALFWILLFAGFAMVLFSHGLTRYASSITLVLAAYRLPRITSERNSWLGVGAIEIALLSLLAWQDYWLAVLGNGGAVAASLIFIVTFATRELREHAARAELSAANAQLLANRELLAASARTEERLRISRDLHDTLGHHLTALSIQLEVAGRRSEGSAADHIREAHAITRLLLSDVRDVVGQMRTNAQVDIAARIRELIEGIRDLQVHLDSPAALLIDDAARTDTVIRCVQEIVTNARRHAAAQNLWIRLTVKSEGLELHARDDGRGTDDPAWGHGLIGMRERFVQHGGRVEVGSAPKRGFTVTAFLPLREVLP